jgi:hypothetical protein
MVSGSLSVEDRDVIQSAYDRLMLELNEHELSFWRGDEDVPDTYADILIGMTAANLVDDFVIQDPRRSQIIGQFAWGLVPVSPGERRLRAMMRLPATGAPVVEYF